MIHAALWVASFLFLAGVAFVVIAFFWRFLLGALAVAVIAAIGVVGWLWLDGRKSGEAVTAARTAPAPVPAQLAPPPPTPDPQLEDLKASTATALNAAIHNKASPVPEFSDTDARLAYLRWLGEMSERLQTRVTDLPTRKEFLQTVWYESRRAGLNVSLTLAMVETLSNFRRFHVNDKDGRGFFAVNPRWVALIGDGDAAKLFHMQTNMRFGSVVTRHYLDLNNGDVDLAVGWYLADSWQIPPTDPRVLQGVQAVYAAQRNWMFNEVAPAAAAVRTLPSSR